MAAVDTHPCQECGACCAAFRVSFYWAEADQRGIAREFTEQLTPFYACMAGTNASAPRCHGLRGEVGVHTACGIYEQRPSPCREVQPGGDKCNRARALHGLPAIAQP
jgi:Fe-S-cluster containining protein